MTKQQSASKNSKTNRKSLINTFNGQKIKPAKLLRNPLGMMNNGLKIPAGGLMAVQLDNGSDNRSLLMDNDRIVFWDEISSLIIKQ